MSSRFRWYKKSNKIFPTEVQIWPKLCNLAFKLLSDSPFATLLLTDLFNSRRVHSSLKAPLQLSDQLNSVIPDHLKWNAEPVSPKTRHWDLGKEKPALNFSWFGLDSSVSALPDIGSTISDKTVLIIYFSIRIGWIEFRNVLTMSWSCKLFSFGVRQEYIVSVCLCLSSRQPCK